MNTTFNSHDKEVSLITKLLESEIGYGIELFAMLYIRELENGSFAVGYECPKEQKEEWEEEEWEEVFTDPKEAAHFFVSQREKRELGFDFEREE